MAEELTGQDALKAAIPEAEVKEQPQGAAISTEDLLSRLGGGQEGSDLGAAGEAGKKPPQGGQGDLRAELESMKAELSILKDKALLADYIESQPSLRQAVDDSIRGRSYAGYQEPPSRTLEEELNLPSNFEPDPREFHTPGTDSHKWFTAMVRSEARREAEGLVEQLRKSSEVEHQAARAKERFFSAGHTEENLRELMVWTGDPSNFSLEKLWLYRQVAQRLESEEGVNAEHLSRGAPTQGRHVASIAGIAGGSPSMHVPEEVRVKRDLLELAAKNRNPLAR